jgi:hypothetical protein
MYFHMFKNYILLFLFLFNIHFINAQTKYTQFFVVQDKDGYVLVRSSNSIKSEVIDTLENGEFVFSLEPNGNWIQVEYGGNKDYLNSGYIYFDRLKNVLDYPKILESSAAKGVIVFESKKDSICIIAKEQMFSKKGHSFTYAKENRTQLIKIDGRTFWGTDGGMPNQQYKSIEINNCRKQMMLPPIALADLFQPNIENTLVNYDAANDRLYIQSSNSDGAGGYLVIWLIEKGEYKKRLVVYGF